MEKRNIFTVRFFVLIIAYTATIFFTLTDARHVVQFSYFQGPKFSRNSVQIPMKLAKLLGRVDIHRKFFLSRVESNGLSLPFALPPLGSIAPLSSPHNDIPAPFSTYPPFPFLSPPYSAASQPAVSPGLSPPSTSISTPPPHGPSPPTSFPSPPVLQPPPAGTPPPPPPHKYPQFAIWCVAKPSVPDSIIQEAVDYACGGGADCKPIQLNGPCFQPNTLYAHASYAFNSYWQNTKLGGGTCDFGGIAMLVTTDPSFDDCSFIYN